MNDEKIFKISVVTVVLGLIGLIILSAYVNPEKLTINQIDKSKIDNQIELDADIDSIIITKTNTQIVRLSDETGSINMVIFPSTNFNSKLSEKESISVIARVTQYNGELELILEESKNLKLS